MCFQFLSPHTTNHTVCGQERSRQCPRKAVRDQGRLGPPQPQHWAASNGPPLNVSTAPSSARHWYWLIHMICDTTHYTRQTDTTNHDGDYTLWENYNTDFSVKRNVSSESAFHSWKPELSPELIICCGLSDCRHRSTGAQWWRWPMRGQYFCHVTLCQPIRSQHRRERGTGCSCDIHHSILTLLCSDTPPTNVQLLLSTTPTLSVSQDSLEGTRKDISQWQDSSDKQFMIQSDR